MMLAALLTAFSLIQTPAPDATGRLAGRVTVEGANTPIAGARVTLMVAVGRSAPMGPMGVPRPQTQTDQDGRFVFDRLAPGSYRVDAQKTGFAPLNEPGRPSTATTQVAPGQTVDILLQLQKGAVITGKVLDSSGEPMADLRVMALRRLNAPFGTPQQLMPAPSQGPQQTNDIGEFRITSLASGDYVVAAIPQLGSPFGGPGTTPNATGTAVVSTYYPGTIDQAAAQTVTVRAGETVNNITISMQSTPAFRVSGRVVDENGAPAAGAMVMLMADHRGGNAFMGPAGHASTGDDGRFTIADVPSGTYRINATVPMVWNSSGGAGSGGVGVVSSSGGGSSFTSWSIGSGVTTGFVGGGDPPIEVTVNGANVTGVRVVTRRPAPQ